MEYLKIILIIIIAAIWIVISNKLNKAIVKIEEADSGIDVALTKRYDVLVKMMDVVKAYAKHEKETLFEVINLRKGMTTDEKIEENKKMDNNFEKLQVIVEVEEHLQAARRMYNSNVSIFNQMLVSFPSSMIANSKGLTKRKFFEAEEYKKEDVKIEL